MKQFWLTHFKFKKEDHWQVRMSAPSDMTKKAIKGNQYRDDFHVIEFKEYDALKSMADKMWVHISCMRETCFGETTLCDACKVSDEYRKKFGDNSATE